VNWQFRVGGRVQADRLHNKKTNSIDYGRRSTFYFFQLGPAFMDSNKKQRRAEFGKKENKAGKKLKMIFRSRFHCHSSGPGWPGTDVMILKIVSTKNCEKLEFLTHNKGKLCKNFDHNIVFWENANFFDKNWQKSLKIMIITSTPDVIPTNRPKCSQTHFLSR
jgi:hypothetical protein